MPPGWGPITRMRTVTSLALALLAFGLSATAAEDEAKPATPLDPAALFAIYPVVPEGTPGAHAMARAVEPRRQDLDGDDPQAPRPPATLPDVGKARPFALDDGRYTKPPTKLETVPPAIAEALGAAELPVAPPKLPKIDMGVWLAARPVLTLRDVEKIEFRGVSKGSTRQYGFSGDLTYSESGARRRRRAETENQKKALAECQDGRVSRVTLTDGWRLGRNVSWEYRGWTPQFVDFNGRVQAALATIRDQPIEVVRETGEQALGPGWKLSTTAANGELQLQIAGPPGPEGKPWAAEARLKADAKAPFIACWESKCCVLWVATPEELVSIHFQPEGDALAEVGELEKTLRFSDAPASVRRHITQLFPPRDGDPAARTGNIEGTVLLAGKPAADVKVRVYATSDDELHEGQNFDMQTDEAGRFQFPAIRAPARVSISMDAIKYMHPNTKKVGATSGPSLAYEVQLKPNQKLDLILGGEGQPVTGRLIDPANPQRDWSKSQVEFVLVPPSSETVAKLRAGPLGFMADGYEEFLNYEQGAAYAPGKAKLAADGSFRFEHIPSAGYWVYVYPDGGEKGTRVKTLRMQLLPGGKSDEALDLGDLKFLGRDAAPF
jgi:hypothetical protein